MKTNNNQTYKVCFDDLKERYNFSDEINDEIQKRIRKANRTNSIPRRVLERRSLEMQDAYCEILKLKKTIIKKLENIVIERNKQYKLHGQYSNEFEKQDKRFNDYCKKIGLANEKRCMYGNGYKIEFIVCPVVLIDVLMAYQFN